MSGGLAIFVKTPGLSEVKSRLAADCGRMYAELWYRRAAAAVAAVARAAQARSGVTAYWAVAEPAAIGAWPGLPVLEQGDGGLGERMARVHAELVARHGFGLLLGADAPQLSAGQLGAAADWLAAPMPRLMLGPARDGGFWLFGGNVAPPRAAWMSVRYSAPDTARDLRAAFDRCGEWRMLDPLTDGDRAKDLRAVLAALEALPAPLPEQSALAEWMREYEEVLS